MSNPERAPSQGFPPLPDEIAFLLLFGVEVELLRAAAASARAMGVTADRALLTEGHLSAPFFYELLARHLGVPYMRRPLPVRAGVRLERAIRDEIVPLAPNPDGMEFALAPRGETLAAILRRFEVDGSAGPTRVTITTPQRLSALVRLSHRGAIVRYASHALPEWNGRLSARTGWGIGQRLFGLFCAVAVVQTAWQAPGRALLAVSLAFSMLFLIMVAVRLAAAASSIDPPTDPGERRPDESLPHYSVVVPLYRESRVVPRLVRALYRLDYPAGKLDIKFVVEAADRDTIRTLERQSLPDRFEILTAPAGVPQTKPRALNVALQFATGRYLVVFDAEDVPEPNQLRMAVDHFERAEPGVECLQGRLAIDNPRDSWLARLFALEYAALFDVINPGLARLRLPIALGGTSNHFRVETLRRLNGWDAWNVTEDVDLGIRLARFGHRVDMLASTTYEEAPYRLSAWLRQRRRWQKGWIVTLQTHSRDPDRLFGDLGVAKTLVVLGILGGTVASSLFGPFFVAGLLLDAAFGSLLTPQTPWQATGSASAGVLIAAGLVSLFWPLLLGLRRRGLREFASGVALMPAYLLLVSWATWQALFEMFWQPYAWAKTEHGIAKQRRTEV